MIIENKGVKKLTVEKNVFSKKLSPRLMFLNEKISKKFVDFLHHKLTLGVQFLTNCQLSTEFF